MTTQPYGAHVPEQLRRMPTWERSQPVIATTPCIATDHPAFKPEHRPGGSRTLSYAQSADALDDPAAQIRAFLTQARTTPHT